ncbi:MAG: DUF542 domain-containing protein [Deltaproteobacteria bacterium]|nr:DUF542 domain-containing protein [Deltaproteobacteria bacterium]
MAKINKEMTINDVIKAFPATLPVFNDFGIDSCCGGARTLEQAANEGGIDVEVFLSALNEAAN